MRPDPALESHGVCLDVCRVPLVYHCLRGSLIGEVGSLVLGGPSHFGRVLVSGCQDVDGALGDLDVGPDEKGDSTFRIPTRVWGFASVAVVGFRLFRGGLWCNRTGLVGPLEVWDRRWKSSSGH